MFLRCALEKRRRFGCFAGGGPAPALLAALHGAVEGSRGHEFVVFRDGAERLMTRDINSNDFVVLTSEEIGRNEDFFDGGFHYGMSRANPTDPDKPELMAQVVRNLNSQGITDLITLGGDDTLKTSYNIWRSSGIKASHLPKTIDNDVDGVKPTFGFDTAVELASREIKNLKRDAKATRKAFICVVMGRNAGHVALETALASQAPFVLTLEELEDKIRKHCEATGEKLEKISLDLIVEAAVMCIAKRVAAGHSPGVLIFAEGIIKVIDPETFPALKAAGYDSHGHLRYSEVDLAPELRRRIAKRLSDLGRKISVERKDIGYEVRCESPTAFDRSLALQLGFFGAQFRLEERPSGLITLNADGNVDLIPYDVLPDGGRINSRLVDINGSAFKMMEAVQDRLCKENLAGSDLLELRSTLPNLTDEDISRFETMFALVG